MKQIPLGKVLVVEGFVTNSQLYAALKEQEKYPDAKIGDILIQLGYLTPDQLKIALNAQNEDKKIESISQAKKPFIKSDQKPLKVDKLVSAMVKLLIKKKIITKDELMDELKG